MDGDVAVRLNEQGEFGGASTPCGYRFVMLARYKIFRGKRPADAALPTGVRQDTRKHTRHCLRPPAELVVEFLADPTAEGWERFRTEYLRNLQDRYDTDPAPFDTLAELAKAQDVHIGCSCPTAKNPDVMHCHTVLALKFMKERYPTLDVEFP